MKSLERAMALLCAVSEASPATLTEISDQTDIPTATTHRILTTLLEGKFVEFDEETQTWSVGIQAYRVGLSFLNRTSLTEICQPILRRLTEMTGETANLAQLDQGQIVFISQVEPQNPIRASFTAGTRTALHASGTGKAILAAHSNEDVLKLIGAAGLEAFTPHTIVTADDLLRDLDLARASGWAVDHGERFEGMSCVGAPILDPTNRPFAGLSVSGPTGRFGDARVEHLGQLVRDACDKISARLAGVETPPD